MTDDFRIYSKQEKKTELFLAYLTEDDMDGYFVDGYETYVLDFDTMMLRAFGQELTETLVRATKEPNSIFIMDIRKKGDN